MVSAMDLYYTDEVGSSGLHVAIEAKLAQDLTWSLIECKLHVASMLGSTMPLPRGNYPRYGQSKPTSVLILSGTCRSLHYRIAMSTTCLTCRSSKKENGNTHPQLVSSIGLG